MKAPYRLVPAPVLAEDARRRLDDAREQFLGARGVLRRRAGPVVERVREVPPEHQREAMVSSQRQGDADLVFEKRSRFVE